MPAGRPVISALIPTYNRAVYLAGALESVLGQTRPPDEVIVVDDGSTDETPSVVRRFGEAVRYLRQENAGPSVARNLGMGSARGDYVALLDSDDEWLPTFLEALEAALLSRPGAALYYAGGSYIDSVGGDLPEQPDLVEHPQELLYRRLLRGNYVMPSGVLLKRLAALDVGLFDPAIRGLEDWDLWLRLARAGHHFVGVRERLIRYRVHPHSLSFDAEGCRRAAKLMVTKLFGPEEGDPEGWHADKRRAYGAAYRYGALASVLRAGDWDGAVPQLRRALEIDPSLARDLAMFHELGLGSQPVGYRGSPRYLDLSGSARNVRMVLDRVYREPVRGALAGTRGPAYGTAHYALSMIARRVRRVPRAGYFLLAALRFHPAIWHERGLGARLRHL